MAKKKIDILFLSHRYDVKGGAEKALIEMLGYLKKQGLRMHVIIGSKGNIIDYLDELKIPYSITYLPYWAHSRADDSKFEFHSLNPTVSPTRQIVNLINELQPRLCVTNTIVVPWLAYAASIANTPHAWFIHELGTAGLDLVYAIGETQTLRTIDLLSDQIFFNSKYTASYYADYLTQNMDYRIVYPGGSVIVPDIIPSPFREEALKIVLVSQIKRQKGQIDAIRAMSILKLKEINAQILLVGIEEEPTYCKKLKSIIKQEGLSHDVVFMGHQHNPSSIVQHADIALVCSTNDAFGRVTVEAMLQKKLIIAADSAGSKEIIQDGLNGFLYTPGNAQQLASLIVSCSQIPDKGKRISQRAYSDAIRRYSDTARFKPFLDFYAKIMPGKKLDLSLLSSLITDFNGTVGLLDHTRRLLFDAENDKFYKVSQKLKNKIKKLVRF